MTSTPLRGADIVMRTLERAGHNTIFTLSGNHIMSLFDAAIETRHTLVHTRHEAAAVHMADAWGRLTGEPGIAMVTGGPGHANAAAALMTALGQESPLVLLSGHTETTQLGRGGFQELRQAEMAAPMAKASWTATATETLGADVAKAIRIARSGRPGPVHLSLPSDLLDATVADDAIEWPEPGAFTSAPIALSDAAADAILGIIATAQRPFVLAGPALANRRGRDLLARIEAATQIPTAIMESPRGFNDATLGAFADAIRRADLIILLGKALDFTLKFGEPPAIDAACRWIVIDPEAALVDRAVRERGDRVAFGCVADTRPAGEALVRRAAGDANAAWIDEVRAHFIDRPAAWATLASKTQGKLHPLEVFRALQPYVQKHADTVLICDGGEFAQWGQSVLPVVPRRMINGVGGSIGSSLPMGGAARVVERDAPVFVVLGDGTFGFHMAEFETAVRHDLPFVAVVGTDARWNAEYNLQVRDYGPNRTFGCDLLPTRYDLVVTALGGHGELVQSVDELPGAIERSLASGKPACINVMIESIPAPLLRRQG
ncbi:MAG TPA: thiamine pyrophosphate-binding protein [Acetobacteraceae bacterium]|jgi:acetolactate synthase-1/2/3 large subunit|nr:thiamine pyrophosphate-binding protein [Acetobacteraceae bacterium]